MSESELNEREQRLAEIRKLEQAATPGPWVIGIHERYGWPGFTIRDMQGPTHEEAMRDADFIAAARDDIPYLLAEIDRLDAEEARLGAALIEAALAERRAVLAYEQMTRTVWPCQYSRETVQPVYAAQKALAVAIDALLAFLEEGNDAD